MKDTLEHVLDVKKDSTDTVNQVIDKLRKHIREQRCGTSSS